MLYDIDSFIADVGGFLGLLLGQRLLSVYYMSVDWVAESKILRLGKQ